ncbi:MAG: hypothetical protein Q4G07_05015 [Oscillospiraceae bacterium]|nr:hypothetical protein [Oscillospiraceae bacterium]
MTVFYKKAAQKAGQNKKPPLLNLPFRRPAYAKKPGDPNGPPGFYPAAICSKPPGQTRCAPFKKTFHAEP